MFFVGNDNKPKNRFKLEEEFKEYNDLVLEDFDETYRYIQKDMNVLFEIIEEN